MRRLVWVISGVFKEPQGSKHSDNLPNSRTAVCGKKVTYFILQRPPDPSLSARSDTEIWERCVCFTESLRRSLGRIHVWSGSAQIHALYLHSAFATWPEPARWSQIFFLRNHEKVKSPLTFDLCGVSFFFQALNVWLFLLCSLWCLSWGELQVKGPDLPVLVFRASGAEMNENANKHLNVTYT